MRRQLALVMGSVILTACPAGFPDLCDNGACDGDASVADTGVDAPLGCDLTKDPKDSPACVDDSVGIFVDSAGGNDANAGTKSAPVRTITNGLSKTNAQHARLYICEGAYKEDVTLDSSHDGTSLYGGFACGSWSYSAKKPQVGKGTLALTVDSLTKPVRIADLEIKSADAANAGDSSIAMLVNACTAVELIRAQLQAGAGKDGAKGTTTPLTLPTGTALHGTDVTGTVGGVAVSVNCPGGGTTVGGAGGDSALGGDGGLPALGGGAGGSGAVASCGIGGDGTNASGVGDGPGAASIGSLASTGWTATSGSDGTAGSPGQGGGGGGGVAGGSAGGGGSGGAGGCGGAGGAKGGGGGGSIALAVLNSTITISESSLATSTAGGGGAGDVGQTGTSPGGHFGASTNGCRGGNGGNGSSGGAGGGGAGGIAVGVLWKGAAAPMLDTTTQAQITAGSPGAKGIGGNPTVNDGIVGVGQAILQAP